MSQRASTSALSSPNRPRSSRLQTYQDAYGNQRVANQSSAVKHHNLYVPIGPAPTRLTAHASSGAAVSNLDGSSTTMSCSPTPTSVWNASTSNLSHAATCTAVVKNPYGGETVIFIAGDRTITAIYQRSMATHTTAGYYHNSKLGCGDENTTSNKMAKDENVSSQYRQCEDVLSSSIATVVNLRQHTNDNNIDQFGDTNNYNSYNFGASGSGGASITCISVVPIPGKRLGEMLGVVGLSDATIVPFICRTPHTKGSEKGPFGAHRLVSPVVSLLPHISLCKSSSYNISPTEAVLSVAIGFDPTKRVEFIAAATSQSVSIYACSSLSWLFNDRAQGVGGDLVDICRTTDDEMNNDLGQMEQLFTYKGFQLYSDASVVKICAVQHTSDCGDAGGRMSTGSGLDTFTDCVSIPQNITASVVIAVFLADSTVRFLGRLLSGSCIGQHAQSRRLLHEYEPIPVSFENTSHKDSCGKYQRGEDSRPKISEEAGIITSVPIHYIPTSVQEPEYLYIALLETLDVGNIIHNTEAAIGGSPLYNSAGLGSRPSAAVSPVTCYTPVGGPFQQQSSASIRAKGNSTAFPLGSPLQLVGAAFGDATATGRSRLDHTVISSPHCRIIVNDAEVMYNAYTGDLDIVSAGLELISASSSDQLVMPLVGVLYGALRRREGVTSSSHNSTVGAIVPNALNDNLTDTSPVSLGKCVRAKRLGHLHMDRRGISIVRVIGGSTGSQFSGIQPACPGSSAGASSSPFSQASLVAAGNELFVCHVSCVSNSPNTVSVGHSSIAPSHRPSFDQSMGAATGGTLTRFGAMSSGVPAHGTPSPTGTNSSYLKLLHSFGGPIQDIQVIGMSYREGSESSTLVHPQGKVADSIISTVRVLVAVGRKAHIYTFVI
eukprot:Tbor_TRINITY_DN4967_c0_g1::TRINITY_DN4967_c0_g1_i1::g.9841::m.9841